MTDEETITVAEVSDGPGGDGDDPVGTPVSLPVVEILTGRGFITGKSGGGKSNSASVVIENLLDSQFPVLIVDTDGEYYGLKEQYEILHAGADDECDIQVSPEHAEKIANLALEQNVPIILDVSGYLDEADAEEMLLQVSRQLFAKEKKLKKPFLMLVEECHEYIPEKGGMGEAGKMLIKIAKRGRKHGLGVVGISQRPADVKKDYITQCDWLVWHRLTWRNDTKVVGRILGSEYADAIEDMGNGEAFLMTDWSESLRRVQFHRKQTFDAGATPGLDDFERPELKSVSGDLVSELRDISDEKARRESEIADLRQELEEKEATIRQLRRELEEAQDMSRMADTFAQAMLQRAEAPYRGGDGRNLNRPEHQRGLGDYEGDAADEQEAPAAPDTTDERDGTETRAVETPADVDGADDVGDTPAATEATDATEASWSGWPADDRGAAGESDDHEEPDGRGYPGFEEEAERSGKTEVDETTDEGPVRDQRDVVRELTSLIESLDPVSRRMLRHYREQRVSDPVDAHVAAGGTGDSQRAYGRNRPLRQHGFVDHAGRGQYAYALPELVREEYADRLDADEFGETVDAIEAAFLPADDSTSSDVDDVGDGPDVDGDDPTPWPER
ncbi:AAA-like domain-containing protein [Halogranum amylolyticum]|uniref:AAA-like domain-containing protein n=1 Tax=Halogranum amylolyticum TaxID=660520 RepID=A0A1H8SHE3_9EURY|nr:DUF87 domain-containing protein [Halogranum amylolyticum]SEO77985.1 AAA-like domain-containing protein [Halogranum amylolyticum]